MEDSNDVIVMQFHIHILAKRKFDFHIMEFILRLMSNICRNDAIGYGDLHICVSSFDKLITDASVYHVQISITVRRIFSDRVVEGGQFHN